MKIFTPEEIEKLSVAELYKSLGSSSEGLSGGQAKDLLLEYGPNSLHEQHISPIKKFFLHFWGPIPWMIEIAALLSVIVGHWADFSIIVVLLLFNAVIGFWQEHKADNAIELLKKKLALNALVKRNGSWKTVPAADLVPGDIIRIHLGDIVPADVKLIDGDYLEVDQSALTGESLPVEKHVNGMAYSGSMVHRGEMDGLVTGTGMNTFFGRTAKLVEETQTVSHYQKAVLKIGNYLIIVTLFLISIILLTAFFRGDSILETFQFALILTVAAIPVALPAVLSVTMAVGAIKLAKKQAIVSRLVAIEEMAGMDVLCSDKTGTLTKNELTIKNPEPEESIDTHELITLAALASREETDDAIDKAIYANLSKGPAWPAYQVKKYTPFDPVPKRSSADVLYKGKTFSTTKGAPQVILALCKGDKDLDKRINARVDELAASGFRTLAVARKNEKNDWRFMGLLPLSDPPRADSAKTIQTANELGVAVKMVTGDHRAIGREIARELNMGANIQNPEILRAPASAETNRLIEKADGYAQVFPEQKYRIVDALQQLDHIVGMTGDGVNDAPALKKADIGIAVSGATDAARSAADLILTAPGLSVIISAIKEARRIFERMTSYATYRISETIRVLIFMTLAILLFNFYPVTAVMIIILALLNDLPIMMIAYDNARVAAKPVRWKMQNILSLSTILGLAGVVSSFGMFWLGEEVLKLDKQSIQTLMFLKLSVAGHMTIYVTRTLDRHMWKKPFPAAKLFWTSEATQLVATLIAVYGLFMKPLGWELALFVWGYALAWLVVNDFIKVYAMRMINKGGGRQQRHLARSHSKLHPYAGWWKSN